jgi:1-aminocyclopropane-1-carboxylate deaminase/D-cysteine desulfhydrase-like pyridoxal-dependent ACC family enzyme
MAGVRALAAPLTVQGISVSRPADQQSAKIIDLADRTLQHLGLEETIAREDVRVDDRFVGPGYGHPTPATMDAIRIVARDEGVILDPVYTGKAMAGLLEHAREGRLQPDDAVVFLHTGGTPALFAYSGEVAAVAEPGE